MKSRIVLLSLKLHHLGPNLSNFQQTNMWRESFLLRISSLFLSSAIPAVIALLTGARRILGTGLFLGVSILLR